MSDTTYTQTDTEPTRGTDRVLTVDSLQTVFRTDSGVVQAVDEVDFHLDEGEILGLVGESGAGKSATARSVLRLIDSPGEIVSGEVSFKGRDVLSMTEAELRRFRAEDSGMIFQDPTATLNPTMSVGDQVTEAVRTARDLPDSEAKEVAVELLDRVGIPNAAERADDYPHEFSGGQKQRVTAAIAVAGEPELLIADEPTTALDVTIQAQILELLDDLRREFGMSILFITHDLGVVRELCDRVAVMYAGSIVETGDVQSVFKTPAHPYTKGLLASIPGLDTDAVGGFDSATTADTRLDVIEGQMPELTGAFNGCKYADRCPGATEECRDAHPDLESFETGREVACYRHDEIDAIEYDATTGADSQSLTWGSQEHQDTDGPVLEVDGLKKHFETGGFIDNLFGSSAPVRAVDGINLDVGAGETVGLVGESGCGKSTAARSILQLLQPTEGTVSYRGQDITGVDDETLREFRQDLQIVFQDPKSSLNPRRTVRRILRRPIELHDIASGREQETRVVELLEAVGLGERHLDRYPHELSGGQQQRVGIARALSVNPEVMILDEPVSGLDVSVQAQILNLFADLQDKLGLVYLLISHDLSVVRKVCDRVAVMYLGEIVEYGTVEEVFSPPYHPYTESLLSAIPGDGTLTDADSDRIILEGDVPDPTDVPSGCRFHPRCPRKIGEVCETETPRCHESGSHQIDCHLLREEYRDELEGVAEWEGSE